GRVGRHAHDLVLVLAELHAEAERHERIEGPQRPGRGRGGLVPRQLESPPRRGGGAEAVAGIVVGEDQRVLAREAPAVVGRGRVGAGEGHAVDVGGGEAARLETGVEGQARVAGVVLQPGEALFGGAAHDAAVPKDGRRGAVCFVDAEDDHVPGIITFRSYYAVLLRDLTTSRQKAGISSGLREVMRLPSTTTSLLTNWAA